jgi:putative transposase
VEKFRNKYRIDSTRLKNWDYETNGAYFITICTQNRHHFFGEVINGEMILNKLGVIAAEIWQKIPSLFPYVELGNFVIMPNHTHGILIIDKSLETRLIASPQDKTTINGGITGIKNPMFHENISRIIRWFKGRCTFEMRKINPEFEWQSNYHDHIIRDARAFENIQNYIENNPKKWNEDTFKG